MNPTKMQHIELWL